MSIKVRLGSPLRSRPRVSRDRPGVRGLIFSRAHDLEHEVTTGIVASDHVVMTLVGFHAVASAGASAIVAAVHSLQSIKSATANSLSSTPLGMLGSVQMPLPGTGAPRKRAVRIHLQLPHLGSGLASISLGVIMAMLCRDNQGAHAFACE